MPIAISLRDMSQMSDDYLPTGTGGSDAHPWGWFEDPDHTQSVGLDMEESDEEYRKSTKEGLGAVPKKALSLPPPVTEPPLYVLESNIETQELWYMTAGTRPRQPSDERRKCEEMWMRNFQHSRVNYGDSVHGTDSSSNFREVEARNEFPEEVVSRGRGPFSNAVSKSFPNHAFACMTVQLPRFKVVRNRDGVCHAEFLIVVSTGGAPFGIWRRHSDFKNLAAKVSMNFFNADDTQSDTIDAYNVRCTGRIQKYNAVMAMRLEPPEMVSMS